MRTRRRLHYSKPGSPPGTLSLPDQSSAGRTSLHLLQFDAATLVEVDLPDVEALRARFDPAMVNWVQLKGFGDGTLLRRLGEFFGLHPLTLEDVTTTQRPKVEEFGTCFFIILDEVRVVRLPTLETRQVGLFFGENYVLTIHAFEEDDFQPVRERLRQALGHIRSMRADYLAYALLDVTVDRLFPLLEGLGEDIERLEDVMLQQPSRQAQRHLHDVKRSLLQLRWSVWPTREIVNSLLRTDSGLVSPRTRLFLRDCYDHTIQAMELLENYRDLTTSLTDVYLSSLSMRTNEIMRVLTVVTTIFVPVSFLATVYGMNFNTKVSPWNMPELEWAYGYPAFWGLVLLVVVVLLVLFRRRQWI